jgi:hypothetical protein
MRDPSNLEDELLFPGQPSHELVPCFPLSVPGLFRIAADIAEAGLCIPGYFLQFLEGMSLIERVVMELTETRQHLVPHPPSTHALATNPPNILFSAMLRCMSEG